MTDVAKNLHNLQQRLRVAEQQAGRPVGAVRLLAVSKTQTSAQLRTALACGQRLFGENYLQEALRKIADLTEFSIEWHFIGAVQSRKAKLIAQHFAWVQTVDRLEVAQRLSTARPQELRPLNICLQVNISREQQKAGIMLEDLPALAAAVIDLPNLQFRGLMAIPAPNCGPKPYQLMQQAYVALQQSGYNLDTLSMGMSADLELAIAKGATLVRVGTDIFGERHS